MSQSKIGKALELAIENDDLVTQAAQVNLKILGLHANRELVKDLALQFYKTYD